MIKFGERDFTRIKLIVRETERDKKAALKFLSEGGYGAVTRECVLQGMLDQRRRIKTQRRGIKRRIRKGGFDRVMRIVPGMFMITAEKPI